MAYKLVSGYLKSKCSVNILDQYDFYIIPVVNPDGKFYHISPTPTQRYPIPADDLVQVSSTPTPPTVSGARTAKCALAPRAWAPT